MTSRDSVPQETASVGRTTRQQDILEVLVFLSLIVPSLALSFLAINQGSVSFNLTATTTILRDLALVSLILFFLWRNGESIRSLGWTLNHWWLDVLIGLVLFVPLRLATAYLDSFLQSIGFSAPSTPLPAAPSVSGVGELIFALLLVVVVAISEETIFRGYLMLRFGRILSSARWAIVLSAFIFALGHGYEGTSGVVTVGVLGVVYAIIYVWRRSLTAPMVLHFLQDFLGIILLPLLGVGS
jgi:membrane protease YdiL (CAAX protease family)